MITYIGAVKQYNWLFMEATAAMFFLPISLFLIIFILILIPVLLILIPIRVV